VAVLQGSLVLALSPVLGMGLSFAQVISLFAIMLLLAVMVTSLGILLAARQKSMEGFLNDHELPDDADVLPLRRALSHPRRAPLDGGLATAFVVPAAMLFSKRD
jgi:hypothetical protein